MADETKDSSSKANLESKLRATGVLQRKYRSMSTYGEQVIDDAKRSNKALFCLSEDNPVRFYCKKIVESKYPFLAKLNIHKVIILVLIFHPQKIVTTLSFYCIFLFIA